MLIKLQHKRKQY